MSWEWFGQIAIFGSGLFLLLKSADFFCDAGSALARVLGISELVVGLTIVSLGTSLPELAASVTGALSGEVGLAVGNVIGSNIANMGLVLGVTVLIRGVSSEPVMVFRDGIAMVFLTVLLCTMLLLGDLNWVSGAILIGFAGLYTGFLVADCRLNPPGTHFGRFFTYVATLGFLRRLPPQKESEKVPAPPGSDPLGLLLVKLFGSLVGVVAGGYLFVQSALWIADRVGATGGAIGVTVVALATSFPELIVSCKAALRGYGAIALGNVIGSNIANIGLVLGVTAMISPVPATPAVSQMAAPLLLAFSVVCVLFLRTSWRLRRWEGAVLIAMYLLLIPVIADNL